MVWRCSNFREYVTGRDQDRVDEMEGRLGAMEELVIVHDQDFIRAGIKLLLSNEYDLQVVGEAANGREAPKVCH